MHTIKKGEHFSPKTEFKKGHKPTHGFKKGHHPKNGFKKGHKFGNRFKKGQKAKNWNGFKKGDKHSQWQGGISFEPYGLEFNEDLKEVIRNRDKRKCVVCEKTELENKKKLGVHHADYDKLNNNPNNLFSLCTSCHAKTNYNRKKWINYFNLIKE